jgi:hypothetical protein
MSSPDSEPFRLSRRRALAGAAWSAPAIVVASAVPAYAVSPGGDLDLRPGSSAVVVTNDGEADYYDLRFEDLSVVVPGALSAGELTLIVTYTPTEPEGPNEVLVLDSPSGWDVTPALGSSGVTVVFTYLSAVTAGAEVPVETGVFAGGAKPTSEQTGTYVLTAAAPGFTSDSESFATGGPRPNGDDRAIPRGVAR